MQMEMPMFLRLVFLMYLVLIHLFLFSPWRVRDNSIKTHFDQCKATGEVVINVVNYDMVQQVASTEYADGVDEFVKSGLTSKPSHIVTIE
jgi:hypothetical protein